MLYGLLKSYKEEGMKPDDVWHDMHGSLLPEQRIRKPTWRRCADGKRHSIIRVHTNQDSYDKCTKCGKTQG